MFNKIFIFFAVACFICSVFGQGFITVTPDSLRTQPIHPVHRSLYKPVIRTVVPFCSSNPTAVDIALVMFKNSTTTSCQAMNGVPASDSLWFGIRYGECNPSTLCGGNSCSNIASCASHDYTFSEFNQCYANNYGCTLPSSPQPAFKVFAIDSTQLMFEFFNDALCGTTSGIRVPLPLNVCGTLSGNSCGFATSSWKPVTQCSSGSTTGGSTTGGSTTGGSTTGGSTTGGTGSTTGGSGSTTGGSSTGGTGGSGGSTNPGSTKGCNCACKLL